MLRQNSLFNEALRVNSTRYRTIKWFFARIVERQFVELPKARHGRQQQIVVTAHAKQHALHLVPPDGSITPRQLEATPTEVAPAPLVVYQPKRVVRQGWGAPVVGPQFAIEVATGAHEIVAHVHIVSGHQLKQFGIETP